MVAQYAKHISPKITPQSKPIPGTNQVPNSAGGFAWQADCWSRLNRFLILGCSEGSYYQTEQKLTEESAQAVRECLAADYRRTIDLIVDVSDKGKSYKNDACLFALAMACSYGTDEAKRYSFSVLSKVARIGTHIFNFVAYCDSLRGWGRSLKRAVQKWYLDKSPADLAYQLVKYQSRDGWSHRDLLRLSRPDAGRLSVETNSALRWAVRGNTEAYAVNPPGRETVFRDGVDPNYLPQIIKAAEEAKTASEDRIVQLIEQCDLPMECVPTEKRTAAVYRALIPKSGLTWLIRNLGNLSKSGVLSDGKWSETETVVSRITDHDALKKARIHPFQVLAAASTYSQGHGVRGKGEWTVCNDVVDALDRAFYLCFDNIEPTNKRVLLAVDISGSMDGSNVSGIAGLTCRTAAAAFAMVTYRTEGRAIIKGFSHNLVDVPLTRKETIKQVCRIMESIPMGGTDCALPMIWAEQNKIEVDGFVVLTDSETWANPRIHPSQALQSYRRKMGINSRLCVVAFVANEFSIADPDDQGMLDIVGGSTDTPAIVSDFIAGRI